jgi:hypothetical protein
MLFVFSVSRPIGLEYRLSSLLYALPYASTVVQVLSCIVIIAGRRILSV